MAVVLRSLAAIVGRTALMQERVARFVLLSVLVVVGVVTTPAVPGAGASPESLVEAGLYDDVRPELRGGVSAATGDEIGTYEIAATLDAGTNTVRGEERVGFVNRTGTALSEVWFRLYPNAAYYGEGGLTIDGPRVGGAEVATELAVEETALRVPLPDVLSPGASVEIDLAFTATVPVDSAGSYGIFKRDTIDGTWILADWYPIVAGYDEDSGWELDAPTSFGDPTFGESALYDVELTAPDDLRVVTSGRRVAEEAVGEGTVRRRFVAGPARDFTLVADDDYVATAGEVDGVAVRVYAEPGFEAAGLLALEVALRALRVYGERFGEYPFGELDLVQTRLVAGTLGVSWAGIVFLDGPLVMGGCGARARGACEVVVGQEVGHQWWGGGVGANSNDHTFMVEGLTEYLAVAYVGWTAGEEAEAAALEGSVARRTRVLLEVGDGVADLPIAEGQDRRQRTAIFYGKAALGFHAIRNEIGDEAFFGGLRAYADEYRFEIAEPEDLRGAFEAASGRDLTEVWRHWFEAAELTAAEIEATVAGG